MKKIALIILALLVGVSVNARHHKRKKKKKPQTQEVLSVSMHRTACFGRCPQYKIEVKGDGTATYTAIRFNPDTGVYTKNIGAAKAKEIIDQVKLYRVDTCSNFYENRIQDLPGLIFTIQYRDSTKNIRGANFGPGFLKAIANTLDEAAKKTDDSWKRVDKPKAD